MSLSPLAVRAAELAGDLQREAHAHRRLLAELTSLRASMREIATRDYRGPKPFEITMAERAIDDADRAREEAP